MPPADPEDGDAAYEKALRILGAAAQTRAGLSRRLLRAGFAATAVEAACGRLAELGYLDDRAFAEAALRKRAGQGRGARLVAAELRQKGISPDLVGELLASRSAADELGVATAMATRLARQFASLPAPRRREKVLAALTRRGFDTWTCRQAERAAELQASEPVPEDAGLD